MRWVLFLVALLACAVPARADQTIVNYYGPFTTTPAETIVNMYDVNGNVIDAHWSNIVQFAADGPIYWNGTSSYCGWAPGTATSSWCGIKSYKCANATGGTDLLNCVDQGFLFDPAPFAVRCAPTANTFNGCWMGNMIYNAANNNYILYVVEYTTPTFFYFTCAAPKPPCTYGGNLTLSNTVGSNGNPFVDDNGDGYFIYNDASFHLHIDKLNSSYTAWDGVNTNALAGVTGNAEAPIIFKHGTNYIIGWGGLCGDCPAGGGLTVTNTCSNLLTCVATSNQTSLNTTACSSQILTVAKITAGGQTTWLYEGIRFNQARNNNNHGESAYFFLPLTFVSDQAQIFNCTSPTSVVVPGITGSPYPIASSHPPADQGDFIGNNNTFNDQFIQLCDGSNQWFQTFFPTRSALYAIGIGLGFNATCSPSSTCSSTAPGTATISVQAADASDNPTGSTLASATFTTSNAGWATTWKIIPMNLTGLTVGGKYGIRCSASSVGTNMYWASPQLADLSGSMAVPTPYAAGVFRGSSNGGSTWTTFDKGSLMFETYPAPVSGPLTAH